MMDHKLMFFATILTIIFPLYLADNNLTDAFDYFAKCCANEPNKIKNHSCINPSQLDKRCPHGRYIIRDLYFTDNNLYERDPYSENGKILITKDTSLCLTQWGSGENEQMIGLVCFPKNPPPMKLLNIRITLCFVSVFFALLTISVYALVPDLKDLQGKCIVNFMYCLALSYTILAISQSGPTSSLRFLLKSPVCEIQAFLLLFIWLAQFFWLNVVCINVWRNVRFSHIQVTDKKMFVIYNIYAWATPALIVLIVLINHFMPTGLINSRIGIVKCWFSEVTETWVFFYGPILILLCINTVLFIITALRLWNNYTDSAPSTKIVSLRYKCTLYLKLFIVMGITWLFEPLGFLAANFQEDPEEVSTFFLIWDYINLLQGVFTFIILVLSRKRALRGLARVQVCGMRCAPASCATEQHLEEDCSDLLENDLERNMSHIVTETKTGE